MGTKVRGPAGLSDIAAIDEGTLCRRLSAPPGCLGVATLTTALDLDTIAKELDRLRHDADAAATYLANLPDHAKRQAAYGFFASFFDHYLPKKFLRHYVWGGGALLTLTEQEMMDCNPYITIVNCKAFQTTLASLNASGAPSMVSLQLRCPAGALTNGTLGQFTVVMAATLEYRGPDTWNVAGKMSFYDEWDFDPKEFSTGGRSLQGEIKTRLAHYTLPGIGFKIASVNVDFSQSGDDATVVWKGGEPVAVPDKIAALDVELKARE